MPGRFIVLEGPDGAGTTLHSRLLAESFEVNNQPVLLTAEPTAGPIGSWIRALLQQKEAMPADALQLLFCADRAWHMETQIIPALEAGKTVICDRFALSTLVYGSSVGLDSDWLTTINEKFLQPDCTILALPPFEVCLERLARRAEHDMFEEPELLRAVYNAYRHYADTHPEIQVVDTSGRKEDTAAQILSLVSSL